MEKLLIYIASIAGALALLGVAGDPDGAGAQRTPQGCAACWSAAASDRVAATRPDGAVQQDIPGSPSAPVSTPAAPRHSPRSVDRSVADATMLSLLRPPLDVEHVNE